MATKRTSFLKNLHLGVILLLVPLIALGWGIFVVFGGSLSRELAQKGASRLVTKNWEEADKAFTERMPTYERQFAYYKAKENQNIAWLSQHFSVPEAELAALNPGTIALGTVVKIPPIQSKLTRLTNSTSNLSQVKIFEEDTVLHIKNDFKSTRINTTFAELAQFLKPQNVIEQVSPGVWRLNKAISIDENIRIDIASPQVTELQLRSSANQDITCLCFENSQVLIENVNITTFDPATKGPDTNYSDGRSFIRGLKTTRMDIIGGTMSFLGNDLQDAATKTQIQKNGGTYGISWRIPDGTLGRELVTGWVENVKFYKNHYGSYTFGSSGMVWLKNHYLENDIYGLDPHDDSNNALVEDNLFENNGKHGFIVSKRCNYNVIRNNRSINNKLHGFMLHQDSVYNIMEDNIAENNVDNFVIYASDYNMVRRNKSIGATRSHVRINQQSVNNYIMDNEFQDGKRGIFVYGGSKNVYVQGNTMNTRREVLSTEGATGVLFANNKINSLSVKLSDGDRAIFGPNTVNTQSSKK